MYHKRDRRGVGALSALATIMVLLVSCQTFPQGERLSDMIEESGYSYQDLDRYYTMTRAAWRERNRYRDTDWELHYFGDRETHVLGVAIPEGDVLHLAFRGSQAHVDQRDVWMTLGFFPRSVPFADDPRIRAHRGFLSKYLAIRETVHRLIAEFDPETLVIVGFSGGGAITALAYMELLPRYPDLDMRVITFGMPRTFNRRGAAWFAEQEEQFLRIVMGRDVITSIPPAIFGFRHAGRLVRMGRRSPFKLFSMHDHWPGTQDELAERARSAEQAEPAEHAETEADS